MSERSAEPPVQRLRPARTPALRPRRESWPSVPVPGGWKGDRRVRCSGRRQHLGHARTFWCAPSIDQGHREISVVCWTDRGTAFLIKRSGNANARSGLPIGNGSDLCPPRRTRHHRGPGSVGAERLDRAVPRPAVRPSGAGQSGSPSPHQSDRRGRRRDREVGEGDRRLGPDRCREPSPSYYSRRRAHHREHDLGICA